MASKLFSSIGNLPLRHKDCGFLNYKTNEDNLKQFEICKNWDGKDSIVLTGKPGTGKTHLAIALLKNYPMIALDEMSASREKDRVEYRLDIEKRKPSTDESAENIKYYQNLLDGELWKFRAAKCAFVSFVELFIEINSYAMADEGKMEILKKYSDNKTFDCICFDDLGAEKLTDAKRENLYYIIDTRYRKMLPTIITSNYTISEISEVEPRIASRFAEMGQILQFNGKDFRKQ